MVGKAFVIAARSWGSWLWGRRYSRSMSKSLWKSRWLLLALALIAAACSSAADIATTTEVEESSEEVDAEPAFEVPDTEPDIESDGVGIGRVEIDGTGIDYIVSVPDGFELGGEAPLLLAFPPGGQDLQLTTSVARQTYIPEADRLGWVVVSPAAPDGQRFFDGSEALVPGLLDWVETWVTPEGGAPHVLGPSNGGISSFRYAVQNPDRVQSVQVYPGFPRGDADRAALTDIADIPIRLYAGETDTVWVENAEETLAALIDLGADVELTVFPGEGHVPASTRDGTILFEQLESFR